MRRILASLTLASVICFAVHAAAPPVATQEDPTKRVERFTMTTPRSLEDIRKLEERVQWVIKRVQPSVVGMGGGSGVVVNKEGLVLTVAHVGQKANRPVTFIFPDGKKAKGKTLGNYHGIDAGMAQITEKGEYPYTPMGKSSELKVGQWVITMGFPISFSKGMKPPVRVGRIIGLGPTAITTDCPMIGGDSGGPLFDLNGFVIGQNSRTAGGVNRNVHVPVDVYHTNMKKMLDGEDWGTARQPRPPRRPGSLDLPLWDSFGPEIDTAAPPPVQKVEKKEEPKQPTPPRRPSVFGRVGGSTNERMHESVRKVFRDVTTPCGDFVCRILCDGKAAALGTIVDPEGLIVTKASQLKGKVTCKLCDGRTLEATKLFEDKAGDLAVLRIEAKGLKAPEWCTEVPEQGCLIVTVGEKGEPVCLGTITSEPRTFRLSERPPTPKGGNPATRPYLGIGTEESDAGLKILTVNPGTPAEKAGLKSGDLVKQLGETTIKNITELQTALGKLKIGDKVDLVVERNGKPEKFNVTLGRAPAAFTGLPYDRWGGGPFSERRFGFGKVLPTDAAIDPLDCGGPVVGSSGKVVGVTVSRALRISTFILTAEDVLRIVNEAKNAEKK